MSTAKAEMRDYWGNAHTTRSCLDSALQLNFITELLATKLNLPVHDSIIVISGITRISSTIYYCTTIKIVSLNFNYNSLFPCLILPRITDISQMSFNKNLLNVLSRLCLTYPSFSISNPVEILIGSTVFWDLIENDQIKLKDSSVRLKR